MKKRFDFISLSVQISVLFLVIFAGNFAYSQSPSQSEVFSEGSRETVSDSEGLDDIAKRDDSEDAGPTESERGLWPESDEADNQDAIDRELQPTYRELRAKFKRGFSLALFATRPWQLSTFSANFLAAPRGMWMTSAGTGKSTFKGEKAGWHYEQKTRSKAVDFGYQWFLSDAIPVSFGTGLGYVAWSGSLNPSGGDIADPLRGESALSSGFSGTGIYSFGCINLSWINSSGFFFEYNLVGLGVTKILDLTLTKDFGESRAVVKRNLSAGQSWGFVNFKIGWFL
jgi:hypothetical protein